MSDVVDRGSGARAGHRLLAIGAGCLAGLLRAEPGAAQEREFLNLGLNGVGWFAGPTNAGIGVEASWFRQGREGFSSLGWGPLLHAQILWGRGEPRPTAGHFVAGVELALAVVGLELGVAARTAAAGYGAGGGLHLAPYLSLGFVHVSLPVYLPVAAEAGSQRMPAQAGLIVGLTWPIVTNRGRWNDWFSMSLPRGRPLRVAGRACRAVERADAAWCGAASSRREGVEGAIGRAVRWRRAGRQEHASVACFARLALELMAHGAPPELLEGVLRAALDEVGHARGCYEQARRWDGRARSPGCLPEALAALEQRGLPALAAEALREGCVGEGASARAMARERDGAVDADERAVLAAMVEDEHRHEALAWGLVAWALARGGAPVARALGAEAAREPVPEAVKERLWGLLVGAGLVRGRLVRQAPRRERGLGVSPRAWKRRRRAARASPRRRSTR